MAKIPAKIGKYDITHKIAEGGMGAVYKGIHPTLNKVVILKKLTLSGDDHITERFKREARIMMDFKNDHIVDVYDHFKAGGSYYIVLEFVDGMALDELIKKERYLPNDTALLIFLDACKALKYAHDKNVIHRDIKPGNILISRKGDIKLVDFGIASISDDDETNLTRDGMTLGTPSYMAPEQFNNSKSVDLRADIYSMGVMLYEMVTGKKPYPGNYSPETLAKIQKGKYQIPQKHNPAVSNFVVKLIKKCMKPKADKRYNDLGKVITLLERYFKKKGKDFPRQVIIAKITGEKIDIPKIRKSILKVILVFSVIAILASSGAYGLYKSGYYHEILNSSTHGAFRIQIKVPRTNKEMKDLYVKAYLFVDDNASIPDVPVRISFRLKDKTDSFYILESNSVYQLSGDYRIKVKYENELFWNSFFLNPISLNSQLSGGAKIQILNLEAGQSVPQPLIIRTSVYDYSTHQDITGNTSIKVKIKSKWYRLSEVSDSFISGNVYNFRFEKEKYHTKDFNLKIDTYQNVLDLSANLVPESGKVSVSSTDNGIRMDINDSSTYIDGGELNSITEIRPLSVEPQTLSLFPGDYTLKFYGKGSEDSVLISVDQLTHMNIVVSYDKDTKKLIIEGI
ncbi:MAG: serine/threonine protein kinase [Spirochaetaceae bacterium]|nr:serine/threonine protein kinase [Spirochaetaceae bacterium]